MNLIKTLDLIRLETQKDKACKWTVTAYRYHK